MNPNLYATPYIEICLKWVDCRSNMNDKAINLTEGYI